MVRETLTIFLPPLRASFKVLMPVLWKTSVSRSEADQYQDKVIQDSCEVLSSQVLKRCAPTGEISTPAKRRKTTGNVIHVHVCV